MSPGRQLLSASGLPLCVVGVILFFPGVTSARNAQFESAWSKCDKQVEVTAAARKSFCDYVIAAGRAAGGRDAMFGGKIARGEFLYVAAFWDRARANFALDHHGESLADNSRFLDLATKKPDVFNDSVALIFRAYLQRSQIHQTLREYDQAMTDLAEADRWIPGYYAVSSFRGHVNDEMRGDIELARARYSEAIRYYDAVLNVFPTHFSATPAGAKLAELKEKLVEKIALANRLSAQPQPTGPVPASPPGSPSPLPPACKMYPNLC